MMAVCFWNHGLFRNQNLLRVISRLIVAIVTEHNVLYPILFPERTKLDYDLLNEVAHENEPRPTA